MAAQRNPNSQNGERKGGKVMIKAQYEPDQEEEQALNEASAALRALVPQLGAGATQVASAVITAWIASRCRQATARRAPTECIVFDHNNAKLKGVVQAALPAIAGGLDGIPPDKALFALSRDEVVRVFIVGYRAVEAALVAVDEGPDFADFPGDRPAPRVGSHLTDDMNDEVPFG